MKLTTYNGEQYILSRHRNGKLELINFKTGKLLLLPESETLTFTRFQKQFLDNFSPTPENLDRRLEVLREKRIQAILDFKALKKAKKALDSSSEVKKNPSKRTKSTISVGKRKAEIKHPAILAHLRTLSPSERQTYAESLGMSLPSNL